jgi:ABC-type lipoprotein export system ATPase subunit
MSRIAHLLELREVSKTYTTGQKTFQALDRISLSVEEGEMVMITGRSGSGKSTLLHIMSCLDRPTGGSVVVKGRETKDMSRKELALFRNSNMGFVFQSYTILPGYSVLENVILPGLIKGFPADELREKGVELLSMVDLSSDTGMDAVNLSGGEQQRVAIARALINDQDMIFADEPTGALDSRNAENVMEIFSRINAEHNKTIIFVTHDRSLSRYADRLIELMDGRIVDGGET